MGDEQYIEELEAYLKDLYAGRDQHVREMRKARWGEDFTLADVPEAYRTSTQVVNLPRNQDVLARMTSLVTDDEPAIKQPPREQTDTATRAASQVERWLGGALAKTTADTGRDCWRYGVDGALADGMGVLKSYYRPDAWSDEPRNDQPEIGDDEDPADYYKRDAGYKQRKEDYRKSARFPIALQDVDLLTYYPVPTGDRVGEVLEICERAIVPTLKALGVKAVEKSGEKLAFKKLRKGEKFPLDGGLSSTSRGKRKIIERWTDDGIEYYVDGAKADERSHSNGRPPYFPIAGYTTSSRDPAKATRSAIAGQAPLVKSLNRWLTMMSNLGYLGAWPYFVEDPNQQSNLQPDTTSVQQIEPGSILRGLKIMEIPGISRDVKDMIALHQSEADRTSLTAVMFGFAGGSTSGYQTASLQAAAQSVLRPVIRNARMALSDLFSFWLTLVDTRIPGKVYVWGSGDKKGQNAWLSLSADDIRGYYAVEVDLRPLLPLDEIAQRDSAIRMYQSRLWPARYALEKTGEEQPEDLLDERAAEDYMNLPQIGMRLALDAAQKRGLLPKEVPAPATPPGGPPSMPPSQQGIGGPGIGSAGPVEPSVPGQSMPLVPPVPGGNGGMPVGVQRQPGGPNMVGPVGGM